MRIVIALEGTLSDNSHRLDLKDSSFEDYYKEIINDGLNKNLAEFIKHIIADEIVVYTTTPENFKPLVDKWLIEHGLNVDKVLLKNKNDFRPETEVKLSFLDTLDTAPTVVIENSMRVADAIRAKEIMVIQV